MLFDLFASNCYLCIEWEVHLQISLLFVKVPGYGVSITGVIVF